ncbi:MAG: hypothetical protein ACRCWW_14720 [Scandinavium sp.]|uniref:hypothetical protein n=1 Tax=Scandinavium sp. TaxID=2830653 RepID=UPI003F2D2781
MGRTLEQILAQEDPQMVEEARAAAAKTLLKIEQAEQLRRKHKRAEKEGLPLSRPQAAD